MISLFPGALSQVDPSLPKLRDADFPERGRSRAKSTAWVVRTKSGEASVAEITAAVRSALHDDTVPSSSVRSYLNLNAGTVFRRGSRGQYRLID